MTLEDADNPFLSPHDSAVAAPWRKWSVWWGASALMLALVLPVLLSDLWSGGYLFFAALTVCLRSILDLHRKHQADWIITARTQFASLGNSLLIVMMAWSASFIAFCLSCTGMAIVINVPLGMHGTEEEMAAGLLRWQIVWGTAYVVTIIAFGGVVWLMGPPTLEVLRRKKQSRSEQQSPAVGSESDD